MADKMRSPYNKGILKAKPELRPPDQKNIDNSNLKAIPLMNFVMVKVSRPYLGFSVIF